MSEEQRQFLKQHKKKKLFIKLCQISILIAFLLIWEIFARKGIINAFISSYPTKIIKEIYILFTKENLTHHVIVTLNETLISFFITTILSLIVSIIIYSNDNFDKIIEPYLTIFNSLPKVALGPLLIIMIGANVKSIILMGVMISIIVSIETISLGFKNTNKNMIKILKTFKASKKDILLNVVIPSNFKVLVNASKVNIGLCLIGVVMGEFLTSKAGLGYLILYGSQIFNLTLVMSAIVILLLISLMLYSFLKFMEKN